MNFFNLGFKNNEKENDVKTFIFSKSKCIYSFIKWNCYYEKTGNYTNKILIIIIIIGT